jgi:hypothetical protein
MSFVSFVLERPERRETSRALSEDTPARYARKSPGSEQGVVGVSGDVVELDIEI